MRKTHDHHGARRAVAFLAVAGLAAVAAPCPASACSICRCGDPAFNALGLNIYSPKSFRIAFDWDRFDKTQGSIEGGEGATETVLENRFTAMVSYTPSDALTLVARLPYTIRELTTEPGVGDATALDEDHHGSTTGRGFSDPELYALVRVWAAPFVGGLGRRAWVGVQLGVKTPWGENDLREDGERLDEHVQPGTGSTDWIAGVAGVYLLDPVSSLFGSLQYRGTGSNAFGYRYGSAALANLGYERKLGNRVDAVLELNGRDAAKDRVDADGTLDPNTGGGLLYLTPKVVVNLSGSLVARFSAQIPVAESLNGVQTERTVWGVGLTYVFGG
jgi:hypothetical protein